MQSNERNPRRDPRPGDVLIDDYGDTNTVVRRSNDFVTVLDVGAEHKNFETYTLPAWVDMTGTPDPWEVLHVAE